MSYPPRRNEVEAFDGKGGRETSCSAALPLLRLYCAALFLKRRRENLFPVVFSEKGVFVVRFVLAAVLCINPFFAVPAHAQKGTIEQTPSLRQEVKKAEPGSPESQSGSAVLLFPSGHLYAPYLADPHQNGFGLRVLQYMKTAIPESGSRRFDLKSGGRFGLVRIHPSGSEDLGWEAGLEAGFHAQFDIEHQLDNIGWDGRYGFTVTTAQTRNLSLKFGYLHDSSHVGDEYAQRTGRLRIGYTREELAAGISWLTDSGWRTYAEYGHGVVLRNPDLQKPGRVQAGIEWLPAKLMQGRYRGWYAAADFSAMQERDWHIDTSFQAGYRIDTADKTWRFGTDWHSGKPPIGEFFQQTETYLGFGFWIDI